MKSAVSFSLNTDAGVRFVENLTLTGTGNTNATGNALANQLTGNAGNNNLNGGGLDDTITGGLGLDTLTGGAGKDSFVFNASLIAGNIDRIMDFNSADDTIRLDKSMFAGLALGTPKLNAFYAIHSGQLADQTDRIIYETDTGRLYFDRDGFGEIDQVQFTLLKTNLTLDHSDFFVFL